MSDPAAMFNLPLIRRYNIVGIGIMGMYIIVVFSVMVPKDTVKE